MKHTTEIEILDLFVGKLAKSQNGDLLVNRRGKSGKVHRYVMHPNRGKRSSSQLAHTALVKRASAETRRQLKVRATRLRWELSYRTTEGILGGKRYTTLRGYVFASCYQAAIENENQSSGTVPDD